MNVQVNIKAATARVKSFLAAHGGDAKHSEVLELVAGMCGFDSYRAMKAISEAPAYDGPIIGQIRKTTWDDKHEKRTLEDDKHVVFRSTAVDWELGQNPDIGFDEVPEVRRQKYDVVLEDFGCQFRFLVKPVGVGLDNFDGKAVLDMMVEINEGLPCIHITNDPADAMLVSVFATEMGLLIRPDDAEWLRADSFGVPGVLSELAKEACGEADMHKSYVAVLDTAEKYREDPKPLTPAEVAPEQIRSQSNVGLELPLARSPLLCPVNRHHVDSYVTVGYKRAEEQIHLEVNMYDVDGVPGDDDWIGAATTFTAATSIETLHQTASKLAALIVFFIEAGYSMGALRRMILSVVQSPFPQLLVQDLSNIAYLAPTKHKAFEEVTEKLSSTAA